MDWSFGFKKLFSVRSNDYALSNYKHVFGVVALKLCELNEDSIYDDQINSLETLIKALDRHHHNDDDLTVIGNAYDIFLHDNFPKNIAVYEEALDTARFVEWVVKAQSIRGSVYDDILGMTDKNMGNPSVPDPENNYIFNTCS